jgi:hypothetical protein
MLTKIIASVLCLGIAVGAYAWSVGLRYIEVLKIFISVAVVFAAILLAVLVWTKP